MIDNQLHNESYAGRCYGDLMSIKLSLCAVWLLVFRRVQ